MSESSKISFNYRRIQQLDDITDLAMMMFPGNRNQQHAAGRIMLTLKSGTELVTSFGDLQRQYSISRRTLERTRAKLARLGIIEHVSWMNRRYGGRQGWKIPRIPVSATAWWLSPSYWSWSAMPNSCLVPKFATFNRMPRREVLRSRSPCTS